MCIRDRLEIAGAPKKQANERVMELLKIVGLEEKANAYPAQLSGGQKQRVAIARALASNPEMLLCDEATSALDPMTTQSILELLKKINAELGITVVLITHEMAVIRQICNKVAILDGGKLVEQGTVDDVFMPVSYTHLRRHRPVWNAQGVHECHRPLPSGGHRRDLGLGALPLSQG